MANIVKFEPKKWRQYYSIDLVEGALAQLDFLAVIDSNKVFQSVKTIRNATYRYEKFWLPLAAKYHDKCLAAPLDIEWVWHCHMLCPPIYEKDCMDICKTHVNHKLYSSTERQKRVKESEKLWSKEYPGEPFYTDFSSDDRYGTDASQVSYDILSSSERQAVFYYQVSLPHYKDKRFLKEAALRYRKYLYLKKLNPKEFLVPCYDIDLIWHTHQLNPQAYKADTERLLGRVLNHDDTVNDRSPNSKLIRADSRTRELWYCYIQ
ncbi:hypothetical protein FSP39_022527 [Pinctada imbricata]|uniref:Uncharacterized protein n=1 Tax=Pinctada imbricata TaxID=66713 RepID=A0AA88Y3M4_PINIB|nr:hypothetical protein FSP39_022527 [Pinctada imbricata]